MKKSELRKIIKEEISKVLNEELTFVDVYNSAKKTHGGELEGSKDGFTIPYKYGNINLYSHGEKVHVEYESGGSTQDTDTVDFEKALKIVSKPIN